MQLKSQRWLRLIPVALVMYTISYVDRTNISLALHHTSPGHGAQFLAFG